MATRGLEKAYGTLKILRHATARDLLAQAERWLLSSEAENNLILGVARRFSDEVVPENPDHYWACVAFDGEIGGCAFRTPPHRLALTQLPPPAIPALAENVREIYPELPGVGGPTNAATKFAETWCRLTGAEWSVRMQLRIHKLTSVRFPAELPRGKLRRPMDIEIDVIRQWAAGFVDDTGISDDPTDLAGRLRESRRLYVWDDDGPRCMVAASRETRHGVCVNAVYTPPAHRKRGYASAAVATLCRKFLDQGKSFCCLYTDASNPTSNVIYQQLGFVPVREDVEIDFRSDRPL